VPVRAMLAGVTPPELLLTGVTWTLQVGGNPWKVAGLVGMTVDTVRQVYDHHLPEHERDADRALGWPTTSHHRTRWKAFEAFA
jgi:hypothetical protein